MSHKLHIADDFSLPLDAVTQTFAILAKRRVGKTYSASVVAEEMVKAKLPFVALDPTGAWWGLRATPDGKPNDSPVIIIGGEHGDLPLESTAGKVIAELVVDHPRQYVLDLSATTSNAEQDRFVCDFAERLYRRKATAKVPLHLFLDEADSFAPQRPLPGQQRMLGAIEALVRRGGIRGIGVTLITQRPAVLNKNVLTQVECLIVLQINAPQDIAAIDDWVKNNATPDEREKVVRSLASLQRGQAWFWSPAWLQVLQRVDVRQRQTFNSSATPEVGKHAVVSVTLAPADLDRLRDKIAATIEKAKADDPKELRAEIAKLKRELAQKPAAAAAPAPEVIEKPVLTKAQEKLLDDASTLFTDMLEGLEGYMTVAVRIDAALKDLRLALSEKMRPHFVAPVRVVPTRPTVLTGRTPAKAVPARHADMDGAIAGELDESQRKILDVVAMLGVRGLVPDRVMVARWLGIHPNGGRYGSNLARLRELGLLDGCELTAAAAALVRPMETGLNAVREVLDGSQRGIVDELAAPGCEHDRETLATALNKHPNGGRYGSDLARLRDMGLIPARGKIRLEGAAFA